MLQLVTLLPPRPLLLAHTVPASGSSVYAVRELDLEGVIMLQVP